MKAIRKGFPVEVSLSDKTLHYEHYKWVCGNCQYTLQTSWKFCPRCGKKIEIERKEKRRKGEND